MSVESDDAGEVKQSRIAAGEENLSTTYITLERDEKIDYKLRVELDEAYERNSDRNLNVNRNQCSFTSLKSCESIIECKIEDEQTKSEIDVEDEQTRCMTNVIRTSYISLVFSALVLFFIAFYLSLKDITQLVGQSIPQVAAGFGMLTFFILGMGMVANRRAWVCGFNVQAVCLVILLLAEIFVMCVCVFERYEVFYKSNIYWSKLSDVGKAGVMANWHCCDWWNTCDTGDTSSIYYYYREYQGSSCFDATDSEMGEWVMDVLIIFGSFAFFHILYIIFTVSCQAGRLKKERRQKVKRGVTETMAQKRKRKSFMNWRSSIAAISPRFSSFGRLPSMSPKIRQRFSFKPTTQVQKTSSDLQR